MVISQSLSASYIINGDGSHRSFVFLTSPKNKNNYASNARSAVVAGQLYLFGGEIGDYRKVSFFFFQNLIRYFFKIARLDGCAIVELSVKLNYDFAFDHAVLATENGSKGGFSRFFLSNLIIFQSAHLLRNRWEKLRRF